MSPAAIGAIEAQGLVPVHADTDAAAAAAALRACFDGGLRVFEFTDRTDNALDVFRLLRAEADGSMPGLLLGAGTILEPERAEAYAEAGADFIVSPVAAEEAGAWCRDNGLAFVPGVATPSELVRATGLGATLVKLFPAADLGTGYLRRMLGPLQGSRIMVTGGIRATAEDVSSWIEAGATAVGLGSDLVPGGVLDEARLERLTADCRSLLKAVAAARVSS